MTNPFDSLEITREEAIDRLSKAQPVYATLRNGVRYTATAISGDEVLTTTSTLQLIDVVFFSSEDQEFGIFDDEDMEITIL